MLLPALLPNLILWLFLMLYELIVFNIFLSSLKSCRLGFWSNLNTWLILVELFFASMVTYCYQLGRGATFIKTNAWDSFGLMKSEFLWKSKGICMVWKPPRWMPAILKRWERLFQWLHGKYFRVMLAKKKHDDLWVGSLHIHIYVYVCVCVCIYMCVYIYTHIYIIYTPLKTSMDKVITLFVVHLS